MPVRAIIGAALLVTIFLARPALAEEKRVGVVATFSVLGDMVANVAGDAVALRVLVGPDNDIHLYAPTAADARSVAEAKIVIANGLGLETWLDKLLAQANFRGKLASAATGVNVLTEEAEEHGASGSAALDPHAWQDLKNGQIYVANIVKALSAIDPAHADQYKVNGDAYRKVLAGLDARVRAEMQSVPRPKRRVITTHDAFHYFGKAYGVSFLAPLGFSTENEPSAAGVARLIDQVKRERIKALFLENVSDPRLVERLAKEAGAEVGPPLYSDALSRPDGPAGTYMKMFEYNAATLKTGMLKN